MTHSAPPRPSSRRGSALAAALAILVAISAVAVTFLSVSFETSRESSLIQSRTRVQVAAESAINLAVHDLWSAYLAANGGMPGSAESVRTFFNGMTVGNQPGLVGEVDYLGALDLYRGTEGEMRLTGVTLEALDVERTDTSEGVELSFTAVASIARGAGEGSHRIRESVQQVFSIEGGEWAGLDFAMLANNVNCVMCHASIDSAPRVHNADPNNFNSYDRVRVGTLEELMLRGGADSSIAGTLYVRGRAVDKGGSPITNWASQTLKGVDLDSGGRIQEDAWGDPSLASLVPAGQDPQPFENLYVDYSSSAEGMVDGSMPTSFPSPFPDTGGIDPASGEADPTDVGNRVVDASEFDAVASGATGSLAGGTISVIAGGSTLTTTSQLEDALTGGSVNTLSAKTTGNVVLVGTEENPILLNGMVAINGDLIIEGVVRGEGSLMVSGNVYNRKSVV